MTPPWNLCVPLSQEKRVMMAPSDAACTNLYGLGGTAQTSFGNFPPNFSFDVKQTDVGDTDRGNKQREQR